MATNNVDYLRIIENRDKKIVEQRQEIIELNKKLAIAYLKIDILNNFSNEVKEPIVVSKDQTNLKL